MLTLGGSLYGDGMIVYKEPNNLNAKSFSWYRGVISVLCAEGFVENQQCYSV